MSLYDELSEDVKSQVNTIQQIGNMISGLLRDKDKSRDSNAPNPENDTPDAVRQGDVSATDDTPISIQDSAAVGKANEAFMFSGQQTDLCYFNHCDAMPIEAIANIQDEKLREAVIDNFQKACNAGLVTVKDNMVIITDKGKEAIKEPSFVKAAQKDQIKAYNKTVSKIMNKSCKPDEVQMGIELTGSYTQDFAYFQHSDTMELSFIHNHPDRETTKKILDNIAKWQEKGFVKVDRVTNTATITENGKRLLNDPQFVKATVPTTEKALSAIGGTAGKIAVATKKVVTAAVQATNTISKGARQ